MHNCLLKDHEREANLSSNVMLSKDERYAILTGEFKNIAHIASLDQISFELLRKKLSDISNELVVSEVRPEKDNIETMIQNPKLRSVKGDHQLDVKEAFMRS